MTENELAALRKAAEGGDPRAQCALARQCLGEDVKWDYTLDRNAGFEEADKWFHKAAEQGDAEGIHMLGIFEYHLGSVDESIKIFKRSADLSYWMSELLLATIYENRSLDDSVTDEDSLGEAEFWYKKVVDRGVAVSPYFRGIARNHLAEFYFSVRKDGRDYTKVRLLSQEVIDEPGSDKFDRIESLRRLAFMYANGMGVQKDVRMSRSLLDRAIRLRSEDAKRDVQMLLDGKYCEWTTLWGGMVWGCFQTGHKVMVH